MLCRRMLRADGACGRQTASMTDADVAAAIGEHVRAFNDRDIDALMSGFTDDACWITGSSVARGRAELTELFTGAMTGLLPVLTIADLLAIPDRAACQLIERLTVRGEENFQAGKGLTGLDEHQVRRWTSWYRWVTLAMLAGAVLTIAAALEHARRPSPADQIPLTRNEIAHLLSAAIICPARNASHRMRWSRWRRRHQYAPGPATISGR